MKKSRVGYSGRRGGHPRPGYRRVSYGNSCPSGYVKSRKTGRCVFKTSRVGRELSKKRSAHKRSHYREGRPSPNVSATLYPVGTEKLGLDGNMWKVRKTSRAQRWVKIK